MVSYFVAYRGCNGNMHYAVQRWRRSDGLVFSMRDWKII